MAKLISMNYEAHKKEVNDRFEQLRANEEELNRIFARIYNMEGEVRLNMAKLISMNYEAHKKEVNDRFEQLRANEEELNRIFARIYNMEGEVPIEVEDKYVSVARIFDTAEEIPESYKGNKYVRTKRDEIVSLISYAVGCMFGRYSLDVDGLVLANAGDTVEDYLAKMPDPAKRDEIVSLISYAVGCMFGRYSLDVDGLVLANAGDTVEDYLAKMPDPAHVTFMPDADNVLPITDDEYFEDDVVARFVRFVEVAYGPETLEMNLKFVADALDPKSKADARGTIRAYFLKDFYKDHCSTYKKRPVYWLLDSGKKNGFKALVYMHRWRPDLLAQVRTSYIHPQQERYRGRLELLERRAQDAEGRQLAQVYMHRWRPDLLAQVRTSYIHPQQERYRGRLELLERRAQDAEGRQLAQVEKERKTVEAQAEELAKYEEKVHALADQMIGIDLDDGVKVNYAKFDTILAKIK